MRRVEQLISGLPDPDSARRFLERLAEEHSSRHSKLLEQEGLLSDVLTLTSFSPLLATTLLQNPGYIQWLGKKRVDSGVRSKDELLEGLAQFALTNSQLEPQVLYARFRRRELLRIYLRDIRGLATVAEITEEISNLADAILESALAHSRRELDNRFGGPQETDDRGKNAPARFCIVGLGKLGSKELNYSSDIDLLFVYSREGDTTGRGTKGAVSNREYFGKLAQHIAKLVGEQTGEGAAYRVDLRLRPHGTLGALAASVDDLVKYYSREARPWERQVLIRSRGCAGDILLFRRMFKPLETVVFDNEASPAEALANVRLSKQKIDRENINRRGFDVKLGRGGIREIEFLAQALQLAHGAKDKWIRSPHTLISLTRLADRGFISEEELTQLVSAYEFLRRVEHVLQMENGVQTHTVPEDGERRSVVGRRIKFVTGTGLDKGLASHTAAVSSVFQRVFGTESLSPPEQAIHLSQPEAARPRTREHVLASIKKSDAAGVATPANLKLLDQITAVSPHFAAMIAANPSLAADLPDLGSDFVLHDPRTEMMNSVMAVTDFGQRLGAIRRTWARLLLQTVVRDVFGRISISEAKREQTALAEASIEAGLFIVREALAEKYHSPIEHLDMATLALGKLGGRGLDYDSDLDLVIVYFDESGWRRDANGELKLADKVSAAEFYSRAVELFTTTLSSLTRDGSLYRVDLRLRPFGSKGLSATSIDTFLDYVTTKAAIWEMLAFLKLRAAGGDASIGGTVEKEARRILHERALALGPNELRTETRRMRLALETQRAARRSSGETDIKFGAGGMLDVYFAVRYLQLKDNVPDKDEDRSTLFMLRHLLGKGSLSQDVHDQLSRGYAFMSELDHHLRLTVGRTARVPIANTSALGTIAKRMGLGSTAELLEALTLHRLAVRDAFDSVVPE